MALRFNMTSFNHRGANIYIEISDRDFTGTPSDCTGGPDIYTLNYRGEDRINTEIIPSEVTFNMKMEAYDANFESFINDLQNSDDERMTLTVYESNVLIWRGFILTDQITHEDYAPILNVRLRAVDGIARLKDKEYRRLNGEVWEGTGKVASQVMRCMRLINLDFPHTVARLHSNIDFYNEDADTNASPLIQYEFDQDVWRSRDNNHEDSYTSAYEVLRSIAAAFCARFYYADGHYWLMQSVAYTATSQKVWTFDDEGTADGSYIANFNNEIDYIDRFKQAIISYSALPPLKKYCVDYKHETRSNRTFGMAWPPLVPTDDSSITIHTLAGEIYVDEDTEEQRLQIDLKTNFWSNIDAVDAYPVHNWRFRIKVKIGDYWLLKGGAGYGPDSSVSGESEWRLIEGAVDWWTMSISENEHAQTQYMDLSVTTAPLLPEMNGERIELIVERPYPFLLPYDVQNPISTGLTWDGYLFGGSLINAGQGTWEITSMNLSVDNVAYSAYSTTDEIERSCAVSDNEYNVREESVTTRIGQGPAYWSVSRLRPVGEFYPAVNWRKGSAGDYVSLEQLNAKTRLSLRRKAAKTMSGTLFGAGLKFYDRFRVDTDAYIMMQGSYSAYYEQLIGAWVRVDEDLTDISVHEPVATPPYVGGTVYSPPVELPPAGTLVNGYQAPGGPQTPGIRVNHLADVLSATKIRTYATRTSVQIGGNILLPIEPKNTVLVKAGGTFWVVNPASSNTQKFTAAADYTPLSDTISVVEGVAEQFYPGSQLIFPNIAQVSDTAIITDTVDDCQIQKALDQTGTSFDITVTNFPAADADLDAQVTVLRQGATALHAVDYTVNRAVNPIQLVFTRRLRNEHFVLKSCNGAAEWTERFENYEGTEVIISAGDLSEVIDFDKELEVVKSGIELFKDFSDGYTVDIATNKILFANRARSENILIKKN